MVLRFFLLAGTFLLVFCADIERNNPDDPGSGKGSGKVGNLCVNRAEYYDPDLYECKPNINANGIYLKNKPRDLAGKEYEAVLIGTQTWMAENLNYNASGSKCGNGSSLSDANTSTCDTYGRLYNWSTAMNGATSSNTNPSKVRGVCPSGWHLPSNEEWTTLTNFVGTNAGTKLKAINGWNNHNGSSDNGTDDYGFSALPGGYGNSIGYFNDVGYYGYWWSSTESNTSYAYSRYMTYGTATVSSNSYDKTDFFSVRCVQDEA